MRSEIRNTQPFGEKKFSGYLRLFWTVAQKRGATDVFIVKTKKKALRNSLSRKALRVEDRGLEPLTF